MIKPIQIQITLTIVRRIFLGEENHSPLFMYNQKAPGRPKLNQLANNAVFSQSVRNIYSHRRTELTIKLRRLLNTGIAEEIIQAMTQRTNAIPIQDPTAMKSCLCIRSVPAKTRV